MTNYVQIVETGLIVTLLGYVLFEVIMNLNDLEEDTTNVILLKWSQGKFTFIPFMIGVIGAHLFLGTYTPVFKKEIFEGFHNNYLGIFGGVFISIIIMFVCRKYKNRSKVFLMFLFVLGLLYGHFFWSMNHS